MDIITKCYENCIQIHKYLAENKNKNYTILSYPKNISKPYFKIETRSGSIIMIAILYDTKGKIESHIVDRNNIISKETLFHRNKFALYRYLLEN